jgi:hypothetical protein
VLAHGDGGTELIVDGLVSYFFSDYVHRPHTMVRRVRIDLPELGLAIPGANGRAPAMLSAPLPETRDWLQRLLALDFRPTCQARY